jgi:hypothetical protein
MAVAGFCQSTAAPSAAQQIEPLLHDQTLAAKAHDTDRFMATYWHDPGLIFVVNGAITEAGTSCMSSR